MSTLADQLKQITAALADLRTTAVDSADTRKALDSLFRRTHNLKSAAAADGLHDLSRAAHELENVLHSLRTGNSSLNDQVLEQLTEKSAEISESLPVVPSEIWTSLKAEERHALSQAVKEGASLYLVQTNFDLADFDQRFQQLKEILSNTGELISITPKAENGKINFRIVYATPETELPRFDNVIISELHRDEPLSFAIVLQRAIRAGQSAASTLNKTIDFDLHGEDLTLEESACVTIADPLLHLVRNAVDHGIERAGKITIEATENESELTLKVTDNGRGIDPQTISRIFAPGFSTASEVSEISGRGVGLDVVKTAIESAGGSVTVNSQLGHGTTFTITLPIRAFDPR
ncbi:MAG TPA: ATP-binding protein [Pyrinomonadaceae bacterium]|nr:ATP-binding protein [Pyrinomonadaceae bacterium]